MYEIDFISVVLDLANAATPSIIEKVDANMTKNQITELYAIQWAKCVKEAMKQEQIIQWSARYYELVQNYAEVQVKRLAEKAKQEKEKRVAKLVTFEITTRVVVDKNEMPECEEEDAINAAIEKIKDNIKDMICWDNCTDVANDIECPFGTFSDDK